MPRYDAAVIGGGPEGLIAAIVLARAGLDVAVLERQSQAGGRAVTQEFHPGFRASPYADELTAVSPRLYRALDLARQGAVLVPAPSSVCLSEHGESVLFADDERAARAVPADARDGLIALRGEWTRLTAEIEARARRLAVRPRRFRVPLLSKSQLPEPWPGEAWGRETLEAILTARLSSPAIILHLAANALSGRAASPYLTGSALHLLSPGAGRSGTPPGGLGRLGAALVSLARKAGATVRCGAEVTGIAIRRGRAAGLTLARGEDVEARAVLSTLDLRRTCADLLGSDASPALRNAARFRIAGQTARVLFALDRPPAFAFAREVPDAALGSIHVVASLKAMNETYDRWRAGALDGAAPVTLRVPSLADPRLAPVGKAVMTATISGVPARLFDGTWTAEKRDKLRDTALVAAEGASPGISARVVAARVIAGPDIEADLGVTAGDLDGGELAPDQVFPFDAAGEGNAEAADWADGRTPIRGLYAASSCIAPAPFLLGAAGERAARALLADLAGRRFA